MAENNVSYMNNCVYLKLDISIWTGKARLTPEDIPDAVVDMPPRMRLPRPRQRLPPPSPPRLSASGSRCLAMNARRP